MPSYNCHYHHHQQQYHRINNTNYCTNNHCCNYHTQTSPQLPPELWFQILTQTLNLLLPTATTPRTYSTYILPLLLTSHTFHEHCHPVTFPHLRKHKLLQLFTRWKAAHSREVHFYHHPLTARVRYALPDRVGNPPGEEYETLYSFIKRAYLFGCESVCGTVIPVEGGLEGATVAPVAAAHAPPQAQALVEGQQQQAQTQAPEAGTDVMANATAATTSAPASAATGVTTPGNVVVAPPAAPPTPAAQAAAVAPIQHHGGDGGGQGWKGHALQWHVANPTFAADGTIELYRDVVEEYRRVVCGSAASRERSRALELTLDRIKNPHRYADESSPSSPTPSTPSSSSTLVHDMRNDEEAAQEGDAEDMDEDEDDEEDEEEEEEDEVEEGEEGQEVIDQDENQLLNEIEAKGGLRRRDSGHGQSSSEMDIDEDADDELDSSEEVQATEDMAMDSDVDVSSSRNKVQQVKQQQPSQQQQKIRPKRSASKLESDAMTMDYELEQQGITAPVPIPQGRQRRGGLRSQSQASSRHLQQQQQQQQKMERSYSASEQERIIMDMSLDKPYHAVNSSRHSLFPFHPLERPSSASSCSSSSSSGSRTRSGSPGPLTPLNPPPSLLKLRGGEKLMRTKSSPRLALQRSLSSPAAAHPQAKSITPTASASTSSLASSPVSSGSTTRSGSAPPSSVLSKTDTTTPSCPTGPLKAEDLGFDLASACANTFASDLAFVLARVPGLGAHFHRFEQLAKLKLHVGWAKHAQSRGGNDVFVMSCSRLIAILAPLANTPLVSERGGGVAP